MTWNLDLYSWNSLRADGSASHIPQAIELLRTAPNHESAEQAYWKIDNTVIVQGALFEAALPVVSCLLEAVLQCTDISRPYILELLVQIGSGEPAPKEVELGNPDIALLCKRELARGISFYFFILESGTDEERVHCVDLLGICSCLDDSLKQRYLYFLIRLLREDVSEGLRSLVENWITECD